MTTNRHYPATLWIKCPQSRCIMGNVGGVFWQWRVIGSQENVTNQSVLFKKSAFVFSRDLRKQAPPPPVSHWLAHGEHAHQLHKTESSRWCHWHRLVADRHGNHLIDLLFAGVGGNDLLGRLTTLKEKRTWSASRWRMETWVTWCVCVCVCVCVCFSCFSGLNRLWLTLILTVHILYVTYQCCIPH